MMNAIRQSHRLTGMLVIFMLILLGSGCKSKKKAMEAAQAKEKARMEEQARLQAEQEAEAKRKADLERELREKEARLAEAKASEPKAKLGKYFESIAGSSDATSANSSINEVLTMFSSPDTPVLIVISESGGQKDYDRPTTIRDYLNYLKDQKKNINKVSNLQFDNAGKITEVELRKN